VNHFRVKLQSVNAAIVTYNSERRIFSVSQSLEARRQLYYLVTMAHPHGERRRKASEKRAVFSTYV